MTFDKFFSIFGFGENNNWTQFIDKTLMFILDVTGTNVDNLTAIRKYIADNPDKSASIKLMLLTAAIKMGVTTAYPVVPITTEKFNEAMVGILEDINNKVKENNKEGAIGAEGAEGAEGVSVNGGSKRLSRKHIHKRMNDSLKRYHKTNNLKTLKILKKRLRWF